MDDELNYPRIVYSDINIRASIENNDTVINKNSVLQSVLLIMATPKGSRWWRPRFGSDIGELLFEPLDTITQYKLRVSIRDALNDPANGEYRVELEQVTVTVDEVNKQYFCKLEITIPELETEETVEFLLDRRAA